MKEGDIMKRMIALVSIAMAFLCALSAWAGTIELPKTGQTTPYATGDDGNLRKGVAWPSPRFTDNNDGSVTDILTGLVWLKDANCFGMKTWSDALTEANNVADGICGLTDGSKPGIWRLPNINELESLAHAGEMDVASWLKAQGFTGVQSLHYWSSTSRAYIPDWAWGVSMWYGNMNLDDKDFTHYVWPVRSGPGVSTISLPKTGQEKCWDQGGTEIPCAGTGQDGEKKAGVAWPSPRFTDNNDGSVTDILTGLVWLKDANCFGIKTWDDALTTANTLAHGACGLTDGSRAGDWRLPNKKEHFSLFDRSQAEPSLPAGHPFSNVQVYYYWASTTVAHYDYSKWYASTWFGVVHYAPKVASYYVWPVRSGQSGDSVSLTISKAGSGTGTVASSPPGIDCGSTCSAPFDVGTAVTLTATADLGSTFTEWSGGCTGADPMCTVTMNDNITVTATFTDTPVNPCKYAIKPESRGFCANGGSVNVNVTATGNSSCAAPTVIPSVSWITAAPPLGWWIKNKGRARITVAKNDTSSTRYGNVAFEDVTFLITQKPVVCKIAYLAPTSRTFPGKGGAGTFDITLSAADCVWTAVSNVGWLAPDESGTGSGTVNYTVGVNNTKKPQTGRITVTTNKRSRVHTVRQQK
jgi:hypothetical protein